MLFLERLQVHIFVPFSIVSKWCETLKYSDINYNKNLDMLFYFYAMFSVVAYFTIVHDAASVAYEI